MADYQKKSKYTLAEIDAYLGRARGVSNPWINDNSVFLPGCLVDQRGGYVVPPGVNIYKDGVSLGITDRYYTVTGFVGGDNNPAFKYNGENCYSDPGVAVRGYTGAGYTVDRLKMLIDIGTVLIENDGLLIDATSNAVTLTQPFEAALTNAIVSRDVTYSVLYTVQSGSTAAGNIGYTKSGFITTVSMDGTAGVKNLSYATVTIPAGVESPLWMYFPKGCKVKIHAIKLELGTEQTLAHQDADGNWQLNELPNYADTLARCQKYRIQYGKYAQWGAVYIQPDYIDFSIYLPVTMRANPSIEGASNLKVSGYDGFTFYVAISNGNNLRVRATKSAHGFTNAFLEANGPIAFNSEL